LTGNLDTWAGWFMALWFGGRSTETVGRILPRRSLLAGRTMAEPEKTARAKLVDSDVLAVSRFAAALPPAAARSIAVL
jgi:hypothetical protein